MKALLKTLQLSFVALFVLFAVGCNNDDDDNDGGMTPDPEQPTIFQIVSDSPDHTLLEQALVSANLDGTLSGSGSLTLFAPDDAAFEAVLDALGITFEDLAQDSELLTNVLLNHVVDGEVFESNLSTGYANTLATSGSEDALSLFIEVNGGVSLNGISSVTAADIDASNGVVHVVDAVITPPNVVDHVVANPSFETLETVVGSLGESLPDLGADGPFTIFAPNNEAFQALFDLLGTTEIDPAVLEAVVLYHVNVGSNLQAGDLTDGQELEMGTAGEVLTVDLSDGAKLVDGSGRTINITTTDIQGTNGVIHEIDQVLLPPTIVSALLENASIYQLAKLAPGYGTLAAAIDRAGLAEALNNPDADLTIFAPNDEAFDTFLGDLTIQDVDVDALQNILFNHALDGSFNAAAVLEAGTRYTTTLATNADGDAISMYFNTDSGVVINGGADNGGATVTATDIAVNNGIIHAVDAVIGLPTVVTFAAADPNFSTLAGAVVGQELDGTLSGTEGSPFTVFAPVNSAFDGLTLPEGEALTNVLLHHVIGEANVRSADIVDAGSITAPSLEGDELTVAVPPTDPEAIADITDGSGNTRSIIVVDVQAINGVIHAIDNVLLPDTSN